MALGPGPAGLKFWTPQGLTADNTADINNLPAGAVNWFNPWGPKRPVQDFVCGAPPQFMAAPFTLVGGAGSYSLTGADAILALRHVADAGSYTLTGSAAGLVIPADTTNLPAGVADSFYPWGRRRPVQDWFRGPIPAVPVVFPAGSGSYTLTGSAAGFAFGHVAGSGSYSVTGNAAALALGHVAGAGSYTLTGSNAALALGLGAGAGSYTLTGSAAGFVLPFTLTAAAGSYTLTGADAALTVSGGVSYLPAGLTGGYVPWGRPFPVNLRTITGRSLSAPTDVTLTASAGSYTLTGSAATLVATSVGNLPAGAANWFNPWGRRFPINLRTSTGRPLGVAPATTLTAAAGSYTITGTNAALALRLTAGSGAYTLTGSAAALTATANFVLSAAAGSYTITGSSAALALQLTANSGSYTVSGSAAVLARGFAAGAGAYAILGTDANLVQAGTITLTCGPGSYLLTGGADVSFVSITPPVEVIPPPSGGTGVRVGRYKQFKLKKKRKHDQCEELLEYLRSLPPAEAEAAVAELPPRYLSLLDGLPLPHALVLPPAAARTDEDDDDACALLLELLLR